MRRILALMAVCVLSAGCCIRLDVPFVPFIADPQLLAAPSAALLTDGYSAASQAPRPRRTADASSAAAAASSAAR